jgi:hypothetical protein
MIDRSSVLNSESARHTVENKKALTRVKRNYTIVGTDPLVVKRNYTIVGTDPLVVI